MTWIACKDKLPDVDQDVILWMKSGYIDIGNLKTYDMWSIDLFDYDIGSVTHWMPLPKEPEENKMNNLEILRKLKLSHVSTGWIICGYSEMIGHFTENDIELLSGVIADLEKCRAAMSENLRGGKNAETNH